MTTVHLLWTHGPLTPLARLSLAMYHAHGCRLRLWTYEPLLWAPPFVFVAPAHEIVDPKMMNRLAFGSKKQLALFSDFFAWSVIHRYGDWFGHLDFTLLKPLSDLDEWPYVFGPHHRYRASMALWKAPIASALTTLLLRGNGFDPNNWHCMMECMSTGIEHLELDSFRVPGLMNDDWYHFLEPLLDVGSEDFKIDYHGLHWCASGLDTTSYHPRSYLGSLFREYQVHE